jgi:3alpha(or 20beta)-hydroxysteroid dehydrogenase
MARGQDRRLDGKVALITGAAHGQGAAEAQLFAAEGASLVLTDVDEEHGRVVADSLANAGAKVVFLVHDVAEEPAWRAAIDEARRAFGGLHVLVNNAGIVPRKTLDETSLEGWNRTIAVNLTGPMLGMKLAAPLIRESGGGSIVNVSSAAALMAHYDAAYTASKWGLRGLTKTAAVELAAWGIRVNSIHPGQIERTALFGTASPELAQSLKACIPAQRPGTPEECAELVLFLASDASAYVSGAEIAIDGGYSAGSTMFMRQQLKSRLASKG